MNTPQKLRRALIEKGLTPPAVKSPAAGDFTPTAIIDSVKTPAIPSSLSTPYTDALTQAGSIKAPKYNTSYAQALADNLAKLQKPQAATSYKSTKLPGTEMTYGDLESSRSKIAEKAQNIATKTQKKDPFWENIAPSSEEVKTPAFSPSSVAIPEISVKSGDTDNIFKQRENADKKVSQAAQGLIGNFSKEDKTLVLPKGYGDIEEISTGRMLANVNPVVGMNTRTVMGEAKEPVQKEIKTINDEISTLDSKIAQLKKENDDNGIYARRYGKSSEASKVAAEEEISALEAQRSELIKKRAEKQTYQQQIESIEKIAVYADYQKLLDEDPEAYRRIIDGKRIDGNDTMLIGHNAFLTDDEKNIYYYLRATQGKIAAQGFLDFMDSELRFRDAEKYYNDINRGDDAWLKKAATVFVGNVANSVSGIAGGIKQFFSDTPVEQWELSDAAAYIQGKEDGFGGFAYDVLGLVGHMTPSMLAAWAGSTFSGLFGATASTAANVGKAAGAATTYLSASGNAYAEKIKQGYSPDEARIYANLVGAAEAGLQYALGGISKLGRNANTGLIAQKIAGIENAFARASAELAHRGFKEIAEEELQLFVEPFITSMVFDEEYTAPEFEEMLYTALLSFASTGVFEISDVTKEGFNQRKNNKMDKELGTWLRSEGTDADGDVTRAVIDEGLESAAGTDSRTYAEKLFKRTDSGKTVSDRQLGHMYRANVDAINAENNTITNYDFYKQLNNWDQKTIGFSFDLGYTSDALKSAGIPNKQIKIDASKIASLLNKHSGMSIDIVSKIPELLENPVIVIDSKKSSDSKIIMGDLYDENGKIVTVVALLTPTSKKGNVLENIIKISSAEGRSHIQSLLRNSDGTPIKVRYVDKKRILSWLNVNRLQLPLHNLGLDSDVSISQNTSDVNPEQESSSVKRIVLPGDAEVRARLYGEPENPVRRIVLPAPGLNNDKLFTPADHVRISKTDNAEGAFDESSETKATLERDIDDKPRKYDFTADETPVSEKFNRILEARQNTLDDLISDRYATEESFNDEISYLEMQYRDMKNPETTKKGIELSQRIAKTKEARDTRLAELDSKIEKARKRVDQLDEKEYSRIVQRRAKEQERQDLFAKTVGSTVNWVDKPFGTSLYGLNTLRRNLRDIVRDADGKPNIELADRIYDMLQGSYSRHEAQMKKEILSIANKFDALKINNTESTYIQMLGELRSNPDTTLTKEEVEEFYRAHKKKIDTDKVEKAITMARETYDSLFNRLNEVLREQGMKEIPYRQGYFPHYTKEKNGFFAKLLNWKSKDNSLPTDIAGLTEEFNPKKSYQPFDKRREGDTTEYNFLEGLDNYVRGALDWIYHIEDIALRRSFEDYIRYEHSDKAMRDTIDDIRSEGLDPEQERALIDEALKGREHQLGNFLTDFRAQTNVLAGKKHSDDRSVEQLFGRGTYSFAQNVSSRINGNMVSANVASALTNFIPLTQALAENSPKQILIAMKDTLKSFRHDDGIREKSVFLTNRLTEDKRLYRTGWDKASDITAAMFGAIDSFVSESIWRSKYAQNLEKGMSEDEAISNADDYCAGLIASRSRGEMPGHFDKQSALWKVFTSFQLEVNNQYGYLFKDLPQNKETKRGVVWGLVKMFLGAYGFNWLYEKITGRKPALDPIGIVADFIYDIAEDDEDKWMNLGKNLLEQTPFVGSLFGGGRIPLQSAIPDVSNTWNAIKSEDWGTLGWELGKPVAYLGLPTGGGQIYKTAKGIDAIIDGGSYKTDSKGNERLQYPYYSDEGANSVLQGAKAVVFGKNSLPTAGNWVDNNFNTLSVDQTKAYEGMISAGDGQRESFEFIEKIRGLETHKEKRQALNDSDFSDEAKYSVYYNLLATKNENEPEKDERKAVLDKLENHSAVNTILAIKTAEDNHSKIQAVADADLTPNDRKLIFKEYISRDSYAEATSLTRKGISYDEYFDAYFEYDKIKADNKDTKVRKTEFAHWLNGNSRGMTDSERVALREAFIGEGETSYDKLVGAGVSDDAAYSLGLKLDNLEPDVWHYQTTVQPYQKYRAIIDADLPEEQTIAAMKTVSSESQAKKIEKLASLGIDLKHYVSLAETVGEVGKSLASLSNAELKMWIERMPLPVLSVHSKISWPKIKSTLYDVLSGTTKAESDTLSRLRESLKNLKK